MHDFTPEQYQLLIKTLHDSNIRHTLMHDVDARPEYSLHIAQMEADAGISATYYFRSMHFASHAETIKAIVALGHRAGYHYESLTTCHGDIDSAYNDFCRNLECLRKIVPVETACAHGSPQSPWNSQDIWKQHDIHELGISYEPMLDTDFSHTLYLTDTGRRWDGHRVSVRDKVPQYQDLWVAQGLVFHRTDDIIYALHNNNHAIHRYSLLINAHPQRWMPFGMQWLAEASLQQAKNIAKRVLVEVRH